MQGSTAHAATHLLVANGETKAPEHDVEALVTGAQSY
jgi:hypothetical protein